jgi:hypothetical protein
MITKNYTIYDQEPARRLLDVLIIFLILMPLFFFSIKLSSHYCKIFVYLIPILFVIAIHVVSSWWSKHVSSNKLNIELTNEYLEISFLRRKNKQDKLRIQLDEVTKTEGYSSKFGISDHYKIYYGDNKIFPISKSIHFFIVRDDLNDFVTDLDNELKFKLRLLGRFN